MGVYYVNDAGGKIGRFNIAGDTPTPEEAARIEGVLRERNAQYTQPVAPEPPKDNGWNLGTAFGAGVDTLQSGLYGATELAGHVTGIGGLEQWGKEGREANQAEIQKAQQNLVDFNNIKSTGDWAKYFAQSAAASIPSMAPQLAAAMIPGALPARIAYAVGAGSPQFIGNNVQAQHDQSGAITSPAGAIFGGVAQSALDSVLDLFLVGKAGVLLKEAAEKQGRNLFVRTIKNAATGAAIEAPTELGQQIIEDLQAGVPINFDDPAVVNKYKQVGITAAVLGSGFGALKGITSGGFPKVNEPGAMTPQATGVLDKEFGQYQQNLQASDQYYQPNQPVDQPMLALPPAEGMSTEVPFQQRMSMDGTATAQPIQIAEQAIQRYTGASAPAGQLPPTAQMQQPQQQNIPQVTPKPTATTGFPGSAYELRNLAYNSRPNLPQERLGPRGSDYMRNNPAPTKPEPPKPMEMKLPEAKGSFAPQEPEPAFERKFKQAVEKINQTGRVNLPEIRQIAGKGSFRSMVGSLVDRGVIVEERKGFYRPSNAIKSNLKRTGINTQETNVEGGETQLGIVPELPKEVDYDVQQLPVRKPGTKETGQYTIYKDGQPISKSFKSEQEAREVTNELGITGVEIRPNTTAGYTQGYKVKLPEGIKYNDRLFESKEDADNLAGTIKGAKVEEVRVGDNLGDQTPDSAFAVMERPKDVSGNVVPGQKVVSTYKTKEEAKDDIAARRGFTAPLGRDQAETPAPGDPRKDAKARERGLDSNIAVDRRQFLTKEDSYKAYKEKNAPVLKEAIAYLKKTAGKNAPKLRLVRKIEDDGGIIRGSYADKVIRVATDIYGIEPGDGKIKGVKNTITHELIHFFREAGFFTDKEWRALVNTANKAKFRDTDNNYRDVAASNYGKDDVDLLDEETVAMFAADWMETDQAPLNVKPLLRRMWDWLKSLFTGPDGEAILRAIKEGEFADRTPTKKESTGEKQSKVRRYNPIQKAIDEFPQEKATPDQWKAHFKKYPIKEEDEYRKFSEIVDNSFGDMKSVTREQMKNIYKSISQETGEIDLTKIKNYEINNIDNEHARMALESFIDKIDYKISVYKDAMELRKQNGEDYQKFIDKINTLSNVQDDIEKQRKERVSDKDILKQYFDNYIYSRHIEDSISEAAPDDEFRPKYGQFTLPGGENYREIVANIPDIDLRYRHGHWDDIGNPAYHLRVKDRQTINGEPVLFIEEIQSDWNAGFKKRVTKDTKLIFNRNQREGWYDVYAPVGDDKKYLGIAIVEPNPPSDGVENGYFASLEEAKSKYHLTRRARQYNESKPARPPTTKWSEAALKDAVVEAIENGQKYVAWAPDDVHAERYQGLYSGSFYDKELANVARNFAKKYNGKITEIEIDFLGYHDIDMNEFNALEITPEMKATIEKVGLPKFSKVKYYGTKPATNAVNPVAINLQQAGVMDMIQKSLNKVMTPIYGPKVAAEKSVEFSRNFAQKMIDKRLPLIGTIEFMQRQGLTIDPESNPNVGLNLFSSGAQAEFETNVKNKFITQIAKDLSAAKVKDSDLDDIKKVNFVTQQYIDASRQEGIASEQALLDLYALAKHAPERNKWIRENRYTPEMIQELDNKMNEEYNKDPKSAEYKAALDGYIRAQFGSGVGDVEAQEILDWFDRYRSKKQIDDAWNNLRKIITEVTLPTRRKYKLGGDMYEDLKGQEKIPDYKNYVPLYGAIEAFDLADQEYMEISSVYGKTGAGLKIMGREDKRALGRKTLPFNIYGSVTSQALGSIVRGRKNEVLKDFYRVVKDITNDKKFSGQTVFEIMTHENGEPRAIMQRTVGADGKVKFVPNNMYKSRDEYVVFKDDNGRDIAIKVNDPLLARSLNSSADYDNNSGFGITDAFGRGTKVLARLVTTYNPVFILTNSARDAIYVRVMLNQFGVDGLNAAFEKELKTAWRHSREAAKFHFTGEGKVHTDYEKWKQLGGETNFYGRSSAEVRSAELKDIIPDPNPAIHKRALQGAKNMLMAVERVNSYIENYNRYALYRALVAKGVGEKQAALASKEITVNFERSGTWGDTLGNFYMFWKAAMNGTNGLAKAMVNSPRIRKAVVGIAAVGFMADMAGAAGEDDWDKIPDYVHKRNLVLPTFMSNIFGGDGTMYAKVPIPYGINFFYYSGILMSRAIRGKESPVDVTSKTLGHFLDTFSPWGNFADFTEGGNSLQAATPTLFDPLVEAYYTNKDFSGRPIMPQQSPFGINAAPHATYFPNASEASKTISALYNSVFGGDKYDPVAGERFIAPDQIDHLVKSYSGGVGTLAMQFLELGLGITVGKPPGKESEIRDYPMLNAWFGSVGARTNMAQFSEKRDQVLSAKASIKDAMASGDPDAVQAAINKYKPMLPVMGTINDLNNKYRTITQQIRKIEANTRMDDTYKKNTLEYLYDRRRAVVDAANRVFLQYNI